ncbi:MAG TPA: AAA family ATPase [Steroidobacteraceae bacterium]|nr:AAA family ATPase [Steroidobacteraceae bacterium]
MGLPQHLCALLAPEAYSHQVVAVRLIETPTSWVLLTGAFAYKIKRPVQYPFVDQRSLEHRRELCEEELRLNRRFAPELYLQVDPITMRSGHARMGGEGEAAEYAVRMLQFDVEAGLDRLLASGDVTPAQLRRFGEELAALHSRLPVAGPGQASGRPDTVREQLRANFEQCLGYAARLGRATDIEALREPLECAIVAAGAYLEERFTAGHVRECHGDLHARNIVRYGGRLLAFDCIEFEPALRWIDVADDLSFLLMDLQVRQARRHAQALLGGYLDTSGDFRVCRLGRMYGAHRALVRAKVAAIEASGSVTAVVRDEALAQFQAYQLAARQLLAPARALLVLMHGTSGSGKTWLAGQLAAEIGAVHIRSDVERRRLGDRAPRDRAASGLLEGLYTKEWTQRVYEHLGRCATEALAGGYSVILDATFLRREERASLITMAATLKVPLRLVHCHAPMQVQRTRIERRRAGGLDASEADLRVLAWQQEHLQAPAADEGITILDADTTEVDVVERITRSLRHLTE